MIPRKEISSPNLKKPAENKGLARSNNDIDDPFRDGVYNNNLATTVNGLPNSPSGFSAAAAAAEKSSCEYSKAIIEPRQTRTSSLRARLSTGQIVKDGHIKVVGFTDFTATSEPAGNSVRRDSLHARKEAQARRSTTPPVAPSIQAKPSRESLGGNRAPAQFVAGSRRPAHPRRPSSRGSLRNEPWASNPPLSSLPPSRAPPMRPLSRDEDANVAQQTDTIKVAPIRNLRKSSIPVPRQDAEIPVPSGSQTVSSEHKKIDYVKGKKEPRDEHRIYEDRLSKDLVREFKISTSPLANAHTFQPCADDHDTHGLEAIEESPQHAYQLKRLSLNTSGFGPTLRISPHAKRFIMGPELEDVKQPLNKKKSRERERAMVKDDLSAREGKVKPTSEKKAPERPSSSQGLPRLGPRGGLIDPKVREKKVKSADLSIPSPKGDIQQDFVKPMLEPFGNPKHNSSQALSTASFNDPFFDAPEEPRRGFPEAKTPAQVDSQRQPPIDETTWISSLKNKPSDSDEDKVLVLDEHLPASLRLQFEDDLKIETKPSVEGDPFKDANVRGDTSHEESKSSKDANAKTTPRTPERNLVKNMNVSSTGTHPPRSSSRTPHPDYPGDKNDKCSPLATGARDKGPPTPPKTTPPKDFLTIKNNLGSSRGHGSTQIDFNKLVSNRDSASRDSYKSQGSMSKTMFSSVRGLFHKRSSENEPFKSSKKNRSKVAIQANGSPFPPISEVHPIHRPTLSSMARSNAGTPRPNLNAMAPATPSFASPIPSEVSTTTTLAMQILESARHERSSPKKERLLELGKIMVDAITQARDAEKAMEEAKQAARKAEVSYVMCKKSLGEVERCVKEWQSEVGR